MCQIAGQIRVLSSWSSYSLGIVPRRWHIWRRGGTGGDREGADERTVLNPFVLSVVETAAAPVHARIGCRAARLDPSTFESASRPALHLQRWRMGAVPGSMGVPGKTAASGTGVTVEGSLPALHQEPGDMGHGTQSREEEKKR